jgi:hypothetical protein
VEFSNFKFYIVIYYEPQEEDDKKFIPLKKNELIRKVLNFKYHKPQD